MYMYISLYKLRYILNLKIYTHSTLICPLYFTLIYSQSKKFIISLAKSHQGSLATSPQKAAQRASLRASH